MKTITLSVHQLVDFLLRTGDIDDRVFNRSSMQEGSNVHTNYQRKQKNNYLSEYPLKIYFYFNEITICLEGRADGIIKNGSEDYTIDEIKSTVIDLEEFKNSNEDWHLGQAKCYAYMFSSEQKLDKIGVRLTYIKQGKEKEKLIFDYTYTFLDLEQFIKGLLDEYLDFYHLLELRRIERDKTIAKIDFPFNQYRKGQRELAKYAYGIATRGGRLFCEAPTGIGKTMSFLFPFIKSLLKDDESKIFYLTAKGSGKVAAQEALTKLRKKGLSISSIVVTAKEKICPFEERKCNPDDCPLAKNYYSKIQNIIRYSLLNENDFTLEKIISIANEYQVCPFELELDLSLFLDVIICDYNYLFDPISYMKRYFDEDSSHFLILVDETHNLIDRSRSMYSAYLEEYDFTKAYYSIKKMKSRRIKNNLSKIINYFDQIKLNHEEGNNKFEKLDDELVSLLNKFLTIMNEISKDKNKEISKELTELFLSVNRFMKIYELNSESYLNYYHIHNSFLRIGLYCLDTSRYIKSICSRIKGSIFFSATLSPISYYITMFGGNYDTSSSVILPSPFLSNNLLILVAPKVSIKYKNRDNSYFAVSEYIKVFISQKIGNYMIYLPSYEYLDKLTPYLNFKKSIKVYSQNKEMNDEDKKIFLKKFKKNPKKTTLGFAIIGGAFSEGIDLVSDRLIGAVIVGIGMPKINYESDEIAAYYTKNGLNGHDYAYLYPGMNKVMQAVGRVIRSETDRGSVLLIDERYMLNQYKVLFKNEWKDYKVVLSTEEVEESMRNFFKEDK